MRYLSVCSGIEACSVAWEPLDWTPAGFSEIEKFPRAVLEQRFGAIAVDWDHRHSPQSNLLPLFDDFTQIESHHVGPVDLLVGGTPCQSFSVAGKRLGLDDPRGNLTLEFLALAKRLRPRWLCWENVPGVLSDDGGRTMGTFLGLVGELGYRGCYRVLDAQFVRVDGFGRAVPQRRRRVFFVGHLGDDCRAFPVLFEPESLRGDPAPRRQTGQIASPTIAARTRGGGGLGTDFDCDGGLIAAEVAPTLNAHFGDKQGLENQHIDGGACSLPPVSLCLTAKTQMRSDAETETLIPTIGGVFDVAHSLSAEGFDASEDGTGCGTPLVAVAPTLRSGGNATGGDRPYGTDIDTCDSLVPICFDETQLTSAANYSNPQPGDPSHPLASGARPLAIAFAHQGGGVQTTLGFDPDAGTSMTIGVGQTPAVAFAQNQRDELREMHVAGALAAEPGMKQQTYLAEQWAVRRLTPTECERLQGFPDGWTAITYRNKPAADGPRYKAIGNSMACNVMRWIGMRIAWADRAANQGVAA